MKEYYDEYWKKEKIYIGGYYHDWVRKILLSSFMKDGGNKKILDIGCGDGFMLTPFIENNQTYGVDISNNAVEKASKLGIKAKVCNLNTQALPFSKNEFDAIFCLDVLEHIFDPQAAVNSIFASLKDDGKFVVCVPNMLNIANRIRFVLGEFVDYMDISHKNGTDLFSEHIRVFSKGKLEKLLDDAGFKIEKKNYCFFRRKEDKFVFQIVESILLFLRIHKIFPKLFSLGFLYICSKKKSK